MASRRLRAQLPPLLHDHHAGRRTGRGAVGVRRVAPRDRALVRRGSRRRAARRPPRRPARPRGVPRRPGPPHRRRLRAGREDPRARRAPARPRGRPRARPGTTPSASSTGSSSTPPGRLRSTPSRRGCAAAPSTGPTLTHDTKRAVADGPLLAEVRRIARELVAGRGGRASAGLETRRARGRRRRGPRLLPRLPLLPPAGPRAPRPGAGRGARTSARPGLRVRRAGARAVRPEPPGGAAVPADERDGDGQGRRGLRVLPVLAAHLAQRGRRRPGALRHRARPTSTRRWPSGSATGRTR